MQKTNKVVRVAFGGGLLGLIDARRRQPLEDALRRLNADGWALAGTMPAAPNPLVGLARFAVLLGTCGIWTFPTKQLLVMERAVQGNALLPRLAHATAASDVPEVAQLGKPATASTAFSAAAPEVAQPGKPATAVATAAPAAISGGSALRPDLSPPSSQIDDITPVPHRPALAPAGPLAAEMPQITAAAIGTLLTAGLPISPRPVSASAGNGQTERAPGRVADAPHPDVAAVTVPLTRPANPTATPITARSADLQPAPAGYFAPSIEHSHPVAAPIPERTPDVAARSSMAPANTAPATPRLSVTASAGLRTAGSEARPVPAAAPQPASAPRSGTMAPVAARLAANLMPPAEVTAPTPSLTAPARQALTATAHRPIAGDSATRPVMAQLPGGRVEPKITAAAPSFDSRLRAIR